MKKPAPREIASRRTAERLRLDTESLMASLTNTPLSPTALGFSSDSRLLYVHDRMRLHAWTIPDLGNYACWPHEESEAGRCHFLSETDKVILIGSDENSEEGIHHFAIRKLPTYSLTNAADIRLERYGLMTKLSNSTEDQLLLRDAGYQCYRFDIPSLKLIQSIRLKYTKCVIFSPQESVIWAIHLGDFDGPEMNWLLAFDAETGEVVKRRSPVAEKYLNGLWLTPDRSTLLLAGENRLSVLDAESWELRKTIEIPPASLVQSQAGVSQAVIAFTPDSRLMAMGHDGLDGFVLIDCSSWEIISVIEFDNENPAEGWYVRACAFSPDGRYLACASYEILNEVKLFDLSDCMQSSDVGPAGTGDSTE